MQIPLRPAMPDKLRHALDRMAVESARYGRPLRLASEILAEPPAPPVGEPLAAWDRPWWVRD